MLTCTTVWKFLYRPFKPDSLDLQPGYSLLLPVPGDLPVFLKIALEGCNAQEPEGLIETLILPDRPSRQLENLLHIWAKRYSVSPLRLLNPHPLEPVVAGMHSIPLIDLQLMRGIRATHANHALIHPVGDFAIAPNLRRSQYQNTLKHPMANPEEPSETELQTHAHSTPFWHPAIEVQGLQQSSFWPSFPLAIKSNPVDDREDQLTGRIVQFPGLLPAYRRYQHSTGSFEDNKFHLLLMRLLVDAYDQSGRSYQLPLIDDLIRGIADPTARITYSEVDARQHYPHFRQKVWQILESGLLDPMKVAIIHDELSLFERLWGSQ